MDLRSLPPRLALAASVVAGVSYMASWDLGLTEPQSLIWKGLGVGFLALYAALVARNRDGWLICAVMAFGALGDVLLGAISLTVGALAFLVGHIIAIVLYWKNRRPSLTTSQRLFAIVLIPATVAIAFLLPADRAMAAGIALYSLGLSLMAAAAWTSRFPRFVVGLGAVMFLASDLFIFAREGPLVGQAWVGFAVWGLYYFGQLMICLGVTRALARDR